MGSRHKFEIVIVDDEEPVRALLSIALGTARNFRVVGEGSDGLQAIDLVAATQPDAIVLDLMMSEHSGMDAIPGIRQASPRTKIVVFSAMLAEQAADEAMARGADAFIEKLSLLSALSDTLTVLCDRPVAHPT
jgi:DNA-binding NarL/FixJ family response regulator